MSLGGRTIAVSRLHPLVDESVLRTHFIPFGNIASITIPTARNPRALDAYQTQPNLYAENDRKLIPEGAIAANNGIAFVAFEDPEDAAAAVRNRDGFPIYGQAIAVAPSDGASASAAASGTASAFDMVVAGTR